MPAKAPITVDLAGIFPFLPVLNPASPSNCADDIRNSLDIDEKAKKADGEAHAHLFFTLDEKYLM